MKKSDDLITRLRAGDHSVLNTISDLYLYSLYRTAKSLGVSYQDFEEFFNTALLKVWLIRENFQYPGAVYVFLRQVVHGLCVDMLRRAQSNKALRITPLDDIDIADEQAFPPLNDIQPISEALIAYVYQCIEALPTSQRAIMRLALLEQRSNKEIAAALQLSESAVRSQKTNAIYTLRRKLSDHQGPHGSSAAFRLGLLLWLYLFFLILKKSWYGG